VTTTEERSATPSITVIVPTYKEVENIPILVQRLGDVRQQQGWDLELLLMDDDSRDGSAECVAQLALAWVRLITRTSDRGLSQAVLEGLRQARGQVLVVMDADLSHPPETLPAMLAELQDGADFVVGSRFVDGGTTDDDWGVFRWLNSRVATVLAYPMSGFFMLRRDTFEGHTGFAPIGYKIGLELLVKCACRDVREVPIHFADRRFGHSKLSLREQIRYLQHVRRLYIHKFAFWSELAQFLLVGASGLVVNLAVLTALLAFSVEMQVAVIAAIGLSMLWNFGLNRAFSFAGATDGPLLRQLFDFVSACALGAVVNYFVTLLAVSWLDHPQLAATVGVLAATGFNFTASRLYVFKRRHVRKSK